MVDLGYDGSYDSMDSGSDSIMDLHYEDRRLVLARDYGYRLKGVEVDALLHVALCEIGKIYKMYIYVWT